MQKGILITTAVALLGICMTSYADTAQIAVNPTGSVSQMQSTTDKAKLQGETFLTTNKSKPGVITLADGLQYKIITQGKGPKPSLNDVVTVNYAGTLINGTEFDSSYKRGEPATFPVNGVIAGWVEALQLMNVGSTWELYIPATLAYGDQGAPPSIGPNETLIFKVELLSISKS
jgi:FKBP-type peptidyl-prolyl cis-trans isomerase FklB